MRSDPDGRIRRYGHIGSGNFNPSTATSYEDLGFFTADPVLTEDLAELLNMLTTHSRRGRFSKGLGINDVAVSDRSRPPARLAAFPV